MLTNYEPSDSGIRRWEKKVSGLEYPCWVWRKVMPAIDPTMLKSVFYIYPNIEDAKNSEDFGETAFFVWIQSEAVPEVGYLYAVSCWLVVHDTSPKPVIRVNTEDGKFDTIKAIYDDWIRHPHNDDVAIMSIGLDAKYSYGQFFRNRMLNDDIAKE